MIVQFRTNVTVHSAGPNFRPKEIGPGGVVLDEGNNDILITLRGDVATLEADEAAKILRRFGGEIVGEAPQSCHARRGRRLESDRAERSWRATFGNLN